MYAFSCSLQARELCPQTHSLSLPLERTQVTHIPASIKLGGPTSPKSQLSIVPFARQLCDDTHASSRMALCLSSTLTNTHHCPCPPHEEQNRGDLGMRLGLQYSYFNHNMLLRQWVVAEFALVV